MQAGVADKFYSKLVNRMKKLRIGDPLDKSIDMGAINSQAQLDRIKSMLSSCDPSKIMTAETTMPDDGYYLNLMEMDVVN